EPLGLDELVNLRAYERGPLTASSGLPGGWCVRDNSRSRNIWFLNRSGGMKHRGELRKEFLDHFHLVLRHVAGEFHLKLCRPASESVAHGLSPPQCSALDKRCGDEASPPRTTPSGGLYLKIVLGMP